MESCSLGGGGGVQDEEKLVAVRLICQVGLGRAREEKVCGQTSLQAWVGLVLLWVPITLEYSFS